MNLKCYIFVTLILTILVLFDSIQTQEIVQDQDIEAVMRMENFYKLRHHAEVIIGNCLSLRCGGAILYCIYIITSAHCVTVFGIPLPPQLITVQTYIKDMTLKQYRYNVTNVYLHPQFRRSPLMHDLAILKITPKITYTDKESPAYLPQVDIRKTKEQGIVSGVKVPEWSPCKKLLSIKSESDIFADAKEHSFNVNVTNCQDYAELDIPYPIKDSVFCSPPTGRFDDSQPCGSNTGGPFVTFEGSIAVIHGIVTEGEYCPFSPTAYTAIYPYKKWINDIISVH